MGTERGAYRDWEGGLSGTGRAAGSLLTHIVEMQENKRVLEQSSVSLLPNTSLEYAQCPWSHPPKLSFPPKIYPENGIFLILLCAQH